MGNETAGQRPETLAARALGRIDDVTRGVVPAIHMTTTFVRDADNRYRSGFCYGRPDNLTVRHAEDVVCALEEGRAGLAFASGMAAATTLFSALEPGRRVVAPKVMYWALRDWLAHDLTRLGIAVDFVDMADLDSVQAAIRRGETALVWAETPANPLWTITDLAAVADMAHEAGAVLAVDSTAATPIFTRPLTLGADIVMHSATKYLNGHSDVIAGMLVTAAEDALWADLARRRAACGAILGPFEAALLTRGLRTLHLRVRAAAANAMSLAQHFSAHPRIAETLYPGLASHPQHALAARQMQGGFGGMLSIRVAGGAKAAIAAAAEVKVWSRATSLGGVESLIEHRASVEGPESPVPDDLLRLSAGIEHVDDLVGDLDRALELAHK